MDDSKPPSYSRVTETKGGGRPHDVGKGLEGVKVACGPKYCHITLH